jgi:hypothetical protein
MIVLEGTGPHDYNIHGLEPGFYGATIHYAPPEAGYPNPNAYVASRKWDTRAEEPDCVNAQPSCYHMYNIVGWMPPTDAQVKTMPFDNLDGVVFEIKGPRTERPTAGSRCSPTIATGK